jgi:cell division cycle protein 37
MFVSVMESAPSDPQADQPPQRPEGIHADAEPLPTYSKMMATLVDQVKKEVDDKKPQPANRYEAYIAATVEHQTKVNNLQLQLQEKLAELEKLEGSKITSESYTTAFSTSSISKAASPPLESKPKPKSKVKSVEMLNADAVKKPVSDAHESSGFEADVDEPVSTASDGEDDEEMEPSELGKKFAQIKPGDYRSSLNFVSTNPSLLAERETDSLLVLAFNSELDGRGAFAFQCVHQALLLQYCRALGNDGVGLFFKRITTPGHQAQKVFSDDVRDTYQRIKSRAKELNANKSQDGEGVEQIQLHAVEPGTAINITIPPEDDSPSRKLFEAFSPGLRRALESKSLDEVNKVLGKMSVEEAEEVVAHLSEVSFSCHACYGQQQTV